MKKKKLIALLLFSTMLLTSCGQKNTSEETENTEFREEAVAESTTEDTSTQVEVVTEPEDTDRTEYWLEEQSNVSVCLDREQDNYVIVDGACVRMELTHPPGTTCRNSSAIAGHVTACRQSALAISRTNIHEQVGR